jgi:hypothetical protein
MRFIPSDSVPDQTAFLISDPVLIGTPNGLIVAVTSQHGKCGIAKMNF